MGCRRMQRTHTCGSAGRSSRCARTRLWALLRCVGAAWSVCLQASQADLLAPPCLHASLRLQVQGSNGSSGGVAAPGGSSDAAKAAPCAAGGCSSSGVGEALRGRVLRQAGLVLGYLHFDGEGCGRCADRQEAMRCFKLAAAAGAMEAEQVLGWMVNTGQY